MPNGTPRSLPRFLALTAGLALFAACKSGGSLPSGEHWSVDSVPERMFRHFTGYRADLHGSFIDYQYRKKRDINQTLRRHFLNNTSDNPFLASDGSLTQRRPPHSLSPDPVYYVHAEGVFIGLATLGIWGTFVPLPIDSLMATAVDTYDVVVHDKRSEFVAGFTGRDRALEPPRSSEFRVKNR